MYLNQTLECQNITGLHALEDTPTRSDSAPGLQEDEGHDSPRSDQTDFTSICIKEVPKVTSAFTPGLILFYQITRLDLILEPGARNQRPTKARESVLYAVFRSDPV
jgi:hypothetical protein